MYLSGLRGILAIAELAAVFKALDHGVAYWTRMIDAFFIVVGKGLATALVHTLSRHLDCD